MPALGPWPLLTTPEDHAQALHPRGLGRVSIARRHAEGRWGETSVPVAELGYAVRQLAGVPDVYLTQNRFFGRRRLVSRLAELDALFVDLDYHRTQYAESHPRHVLDLALETLETERLPTPSFAIATGRGLALIWLHWAVPRAALPRWRACQQVLGRVLRHFGAVSLHHPSRASDRVEHMNYTVGLTWTVPRFGGRRWWISCPISGRRCAVLYLPRGARQFGSAKGYGLAYRVTRMETHDRLWHRMEKIARRLGDRRPEPEIPPRRPKWMRTAIYDRLLVAWHEAGERRDEIYDAKIAGCIARLSRLGG